MPSDDGANLAGIRRRAFEEAASLAERLIGDAAVGRDWTEPSQVRGFSVGGLAAHMYAAVRRLEVGLDEPLAAQPVVVGLPEFYGPNRIDSPDAVDAGFHATIRDDAERRAERGPVVVHNRFRDLIERLDARLETEPQERVVPVIQVRDGVTPLHVYVASRVTELIVHSDDLAASVGLPPPPVPPTAGSVVIDVLVELARARVGDLEVVRGFARAERATPDALRVL